MNKIFKYGAQALLGLILLTATALAQTSIQSNTKTNQIMEQRLSFITIGAKDLAKLKQFYIEKFNWKPIKDDQGLSSLK